MPQPATVRSAVAGPEPVETLTLKAQDGLPLFVRVWAPPPDMKGLVAVVHGYAEHGGRYKAVAARLAEEGFGTIAYDVRGHGNSGGARGACLRFQEFLDDTDLFLKLAAERTGGKPLVLLGHSHGGLILLRRLLAGPLPVKVAGAIVTSPFLGIAIPVSGVKLFAAEALSNVWPSLSLKNEIDPALVSHDAEVVRLYATDPQVFKTANARWFTESRDAQNHVMAHAAELPVPTTIIQAGDDRIASPSATRAAVKAAGAKVRYVELDGLFHEVLNEVERERAFAEIFRSLAEWTA